MVEKLILLMVAQGVAGVLALIRLWFSNERLKERVKDIERHNKELLDKITAMGQDMAVIKSHFELGTLTRIKTHGK